MKRAISISLFSVLLLTLTACGEGRAHFEQAMTKKLADDPDLKDYHLDPKDMAECVVDSVASSLPLIPGHPKRNDYYEAYAKIVGVTPEDNAFEVIEKNKEVFGSVEEARKAALEITDYVMECMGKLSEPG